MIYKNSVEFQVSGDYALFSDPTMRPGGEKCTLQIPTYEALKGVLHSIYWKPTIIWLIDQVRVMHSIQTTAKGIRPIKYDKDSNDLSYYTYLKDCCYKVKAHFIWNENRPELAHDRNEHKHYQIAQRMIERGGRRDIFLGTRECQAYVEPCNFAEGIGAYDHIEELSFGLMYHGITYADEAYSEQTQNSMTLRYWQPIMKKGIISFCSPEQCTITHKARAMEIKPFVESLNNFTGLAEFADGEV